MPKKPLPLTTYIPPELEEISQLMVKYQLDSVEYNGIKIIKSIHESKAQVERKKKAKEEPPFVPFNLPPLTKPKDDEVLFYSTDRPDINIEEQLKKMGITMPPHIQDT